MTNPPRAKAARITRAAPGEPILLSLLFAPDQLRVVDVLVDGSRFEQIEINQNQLRNFWHSVGTP